MSILRANLRLLYQRWQLWVTYFFVGVLVALGLVMVRFGVGIALNVLIPVALVAGWAVAMVQAEILAKPVSCYLPGYRENLRTFVFTVGLALSVAGGLGFAWVHRSPDAFAARLFLMLCLGLCVTELVYLAMFAATLAFGSILVDPLVLVVFLSLLRSREASTLGFDATLMMHPVLVISLGVFVGVGVWWQLGRAEWFRRRRAKRVFTRVSLAGLRRGRPSAEETRQMAALINWPSLHPVVESCFLNLIQGGKPSSPVRYFWGAVYSTQLPLLLLLVAKWKKVIPAILIWFAAVLAAGYVPRFGLALLAIPAMIAAIFPITGLPLLSSLPIRGGRRERFYVAVLLVPLLTVLSTGIFLLPVLLVNSVSPWLPDVAALTFHSIPLWLPMFPLLVTPIFGLGAAWFYGHPGGWSGIGFLLGAAFVGLMFMVLRPLLSVPLVGVVTLATLAWLFFFLGVRQVTLHGDLAQHP